MKGAPWLAYQTPIIISYSPPGNSRGIYARKFCNLKFAGINELKLFFVVYYLTVWVYTTTTSRFHFCEKFLTSSVKYLVNFEL